MDAQDIAIQSIADTDRLGQALGRALPAGSVISLVGPLGAGKTRLVQAVAEELGVDREAVTSPTFVLVNEYTTGEKPVYHFDAYRLQDDTEFLDLGPEEYFDGAGLTFVEWGDRVAASLPRRVVRVAFTVLEGESRSVRIENGPCLDPQDYRGASTGSS